MQLAILAVLILIAVILAPWLLGVMAALFAAAVAFFGVVMAIVVIAAAVGVIGAVVWHVYLALTKESDKPTKIRGKRKACNSCQVELPVTASTCRSCGATT